MRHVVAGVAVAAGGLLLTGCGWEGDGGTTFEDHQPLGQEITEVRFSNDSGTVKITVGDEPEVRRTVSYGDEKPGRTHRVAGGALLLEACPVRDCKVDYEVVVPAGAEVSGRVDSGTVELAGVASANVAAESGTVEVRDVAGEVNVTVQSGTVDLTGIGGAVVAQAESGNVTVALTSARNVSARTESGDIEVTVPDGNYHVRTATENGEVHNELGDGGAGPELDLQAENGDITIRRAA
jgi:hypothetical protein